uniref:Uncharacterized protein n=1 Tax=Anguilla anguilla TaxID=7936 RepID=A0A0E9REW2_ANGAN
MPSYQKHSTKLIVKTQGKTKQKQRTSLVCSRAATPQWDATMSEGCPDRVEHEKEY